MAAIVPFIPMIISAVGSIAQGVAGSQSGSANASAASGEGRLAVQQARLDEEQSRRRSAQIMGKQHAIAAAAGLDTTTGTPLDLALDAAEQAEMEALNIRYMGKLRKYAANQQASAYQSQGQGSLFSGMLGGASSFMGQGSMLAKMFSSSGGAAAGSAPGSSGLVSGMGY